ncbi:XylR family transcriptional regulator [Actinobacillus seminis]|uniref:Helix-turn-helix domain-containing protein n=1 Tax=Actinobacillus seminis TaxID=722 RepID=A0A263HCW1_9PAST|nr:XylR family transcriptional regulator [Actinobacillus seminis]OZN24497.1 XylR family transcriptional regulator [Actinobacillus seminis]SUU38491.1 helix-turn-helix domain-containing protein [Actinobacillus seminis]
MEQRFKIALLFNANKIYDRGVIEGIGQYIQASQCTWDIFMEDEFIYHSDTIKNLSIDGIIADYDDPETVELLKNIEVPIIGVGSSYQNPEDYPNVPYVATDNNALIENAFLHLKQKGIDQFAFYGYPTTQKKHWSVERLNAFIQLMEKYEHKPVFYLGDKIHSYNWETSQEKLCGWIKTLPLHTGIIAVTDARARHLLQACEYLKIAVPDQLCIIGIDNEELIQYLSRVSLSSVVQGTKQIGYQAAKLLHKRLLDQPVSNKPMLIQPFKIEERRSTDYRSLQDPLVIQAMHFIRHRATQGIKTEQVLDHLRVSRSNLEQRFKEEMHKTIHQVIHEEKLARAKQLLHLTDLPIQEIAEVCGYPSLQYFYAVFKKELNLTPKAFRDNE